jgi:hypothetical protein
MELARVTIEALTKIVSAPETVPKPEPNLPEYSAAVAATQSLALYEEPDG